MSLKRLRFVAASYICQSNLQTKFGKRATVIYPPVRLESTTGYDKKRDMVVSMGRISPEKNFQAIVLVGPRVPETEFVLVGPGGRWGAVDMIAKSFAEKGMEGHFTYLGWVRREDSAQLQQSAKVLFRPAAKDPFPLVVLEAMNRGAIPVVHNSGGARELVPYVLTYNDQD
jgi:glycosyltransferase involved in cell wall biosynthesis